jgi:hypothetical protein
MSADREEPPGRRGRFLLGVGPALLRAAQALGIFAPYAPDAHWTAGDPIEQARAQAREGEASLIAAAIALTLSLDEDAFLDDEPRVLTLRHAARNSSNWWQSRLSPSSLPPRRVGPPVRPDVFVIPEPGPGPALGPEPGPPAGR